MQQGREEVDFRISVDQRKIVKFTAMIILHFHLQPQFKNELFHVYFTSSLLLVADFKRISVHFI